MERIDEITAVYLMDLIQVTKDETFDPALREEIRNELLELKEEIDREISLYE